MKARLAWLAVVLLSAAIVDGATVLSAQSQQRVSTRSRSGQFLVNGLPLNRPLLNFAPTSAVTYARLDPTLLPVSLENIKQALLSTLNLTDRWQGRIAISLQPLQRDNEEILIASVRYTDGWQYRLQMPEHVNKDRFTRAIVEVLLLEIAHRNAGERRLELPPWLAPGLAAHLMATASSPLIVEPETVTSRKLRVERAIKQTREALRGSGGLSIDQLNWPDSSTDPAIYEAAAHLFVRELLRSRGGMPLSDMLAHLRDHLNWQTAFLRAFGFRSLREVDKWWTFQLVQFTGRENLAMWSPEEVQRQLDDILNTSIAVRHDVDQLPTMARLPLQQLLEEWEVPRQSTVLRQKLQSLEALRLRAPVPLSEMVSGYKQSLAYYLDRRERLGRKKTSSSPAVKALLVETFQKLNELDVRRQLIAGGAPNATALSNPRE